LMYLDGSVVSCYGEGEDQLTCDRSVDTTVGVTARPTKGAFIVQTVVFCSNDKCRNTPPTNC